MSGGLPHAMYEGLVEHRRSTPVDHAFRYRINFVYLDLDELDSAFAGRWLWSQTRPAAAWFRRADHLGDPRASLADAVRQMVRSAGVAANGPIRLLTQLRYWGFVMNPVSFYFCFEERGEELQAVVAEVNNTPWGEQHCYVLPWTLAGASEARLEKEFHVSPFMPMEVQYRWQVGAPGETLQVGIENYQAGELFFTARLNLRRRPWTTGQLLRGLLLFPFMTQRVYLGIYWQALRLWWKGARYFPHPGTMRRTRQEEALACGERG